MNRLTFVLMFDSAVFFVTKIPIKVGIQSNMTRCGEAGFPAYGIRVDFFQAEKGAWLTRLPAFAHECGYVT